MYANVLVAAGVSWPISVNVSTVSTSSTSVLTLVFIAAVRSPLVAALVRLVAVLVVVTDGDDIQYATITDNIHRSKDAASAVGILQSDQTGNTGILARNLSANLDTVGERIATGENTGLYYYENFTSSDVVKRGYILPARDA